MRTNKDILNLIFEVSPHLEYEINEQGCVTILEKQDHKIQNFFRKLNVKIPLYKKISFDEYASFVFLQIDGTKKVEEIGKCIESVYGDDAYPLYERLLLFLNHIDVNCNYIKKSCE